MIRPTTKSANASDVINQLGRMCSRALEMITNITKPFPRIAMALAIQPMIKNQDMAISTVFDLRTL